MRKLIFLSLIAAVAIPSLASAQSAGELRRDERAIHEARQDLREAQREGDRRDIRDSREDLRDAKREHREDWRDHRAAHRDTYRRHTYSGPRGYVYRPVEVGHRFAPAYYGSRYIIADPWRYRLPPVVGRQRWVRYGNDVVLINSRNGRVLEVHRGFFW